MIPFIVLFFVVCLAFYFLGRQSRVAPVEPTILPDSTENLIQWHKILPALKSAPPHELRIMKLTFATMVKVVREMDNIGLGIQGCLLSF